MAQTPGLPRRAAAHLLHSLAETPIQLLTGAAVLGVAGFIASLWDHRRLSGAIFVGVAVFAMASVGLYVASLWLASARAGRRPDWLTQVSIWDWENPRVTVVEREVDTSALRSSHRIDFKFTLVNTNIFALQVNPAMATGRLSMTNIECAQPPEVNPPASTPIMIQRGNRETIVIRQFVPELMGYFREDTVIPFRFSGYKLPVRPFNPYAKTEDPEGRFGAGVPVALGEVRVPGGDAG